MKTKSPRPPAVATSTRDGWRSLEHRVLKRRSAGSRGLRRRHARVDPSGKLVRDAFETWRARLGSFRFTARLTTVALGVLAAADLFDDTPPLRQVALIAAVLIAGAGSLLALFAAERQGVTAVQSRRWQLQAVASAVVMFMLMLNGSDSASGDLLWFVIVVAAASTLVAMATSYRDVSGSGIGGICLALDSAIVGFTTALITVALASP